LRKEITKSEKFRF